MIHMHAHKYKHVPFTRLRFTQCYQELKTGFEYYNASSTEKAMQTQQLTKLN